MAKNNDKIPAIMSAFESFLYSWKAQSSQKPQLYGWQHLLALGLIAVATFLLIFFFRNAKEKTYRRIMGIGFIVLLLAEAYKQLIYSMSLKDGVLVWSYNWKQFPFQFCSSILYALPVIAFCKNKRINDAFSAFLCFYIFFAGASVVIYPSTVLSKTIGVLIQTFLHHGAQVALGLYAIVYNRKKFCFSFYLEASVVFLVFLLIAVILNLTVYPNATGGASFNMFYIDYRQKCDLPILSTIKENAP